MKSHIISNKLYSPQNFIEKVTGKCFTFGADVNSNISTIETILFKEGLDNENSPLWNFPLNEIEEIIEADSKVVLVECMEFNEVTSRYEKEYRWFEVPECAVKNFD